MDFKRIERKIEECQKKFERLKASGFYSETYLEEERTNLLNDIKRERDKVYNEARKNLEEQLEKIKKAYDQEPADASEELLNFRKLETKIKASKTDDLTKKAEQFYKSQSGDPNELQLIAAEMRSRGQVDDADMLVSQMDALNAESQWQNDAKYQEIKKDLSKLDVYRNQDDMALMASGEVVFIENEI